MLLNPTSLTSSSLQMFPNEILLMMFSETDIPTLLSLCNTNKRFRRLANICLVDKFKQQNIGLTLNFGQEHKLRSNITMEFHHVNKNNGNFVFQPKEDIQLKFYHSQMLKNPKIYKVTPTQDIKTTTNKDGNLLQQSIGFSIKIREGISQKFQSVYRIGNGNSHLKVPFAFTYSSTDIPPPNDTKSRGGERWVTPLSFECPPSFFYPNEAAVHRILMSMMNYKPTTKKQQTIKKADCCLNEKQKQRISFQQESQIQESILQQIPQIKEVHEEKKKLFKISSKWVRGARY